jgi:hypothetical protein
MKYSKLNRLARRWLPVLILFLQALNQVAELVSRVVNYGSKVRKLHALVQA